VAEREGFEPRYRCPSRISSASPIRSNELPLEPTASEHAHARPIPRCGGNQQGNLERRPTLRRDDRPRPEPATNRQDQDTGITLLRWGTGSPASMDWSRRTFPALRRTSAATTRCSMDVWGGDRSRTVNFRSLLRHHRASHVHHSAAHRGRLNLALSELSSYRSVIAVAL